MTDQQRLTGCLGIIFTLFGIAPTYAGSDVGSAATALLHNLRPLSRRPPS